MLNCCNLHLICINTDMFAPPTHVKWAVKTQLNSDSRLKPANTVRRDVRVKYESETEGFQRWSGSSWQSDDSTELRDWLLENGSTIGKEDPMRVQLRPTCCHYTQDLYNGADSFVGLSNYLKHLKSLLARSMSLSAGCGAVAQRKQGKDKSNMHRKQCSGSAPSTPVGWKRYSPAGYSCKGLQSGNGWTIGNQTSAIPCRNYNRLHKHDSFSDWLNCTRQAKLDNQHHTYTNRSKAGTYCSRSVPAAKDNNQPCEPNAACAETATPTPIPQHYNNSSDEHVQAMSNAEPAAAQETPALPPQHNTMQEYIEKYYTSPSQMPAGGVALPVITEKNQRLVENIINYRHTSTREREAIHKSRYLQLTATDIRRTTALLLKTSLGRNITKNQSNQLYPDLSIKRGPAATSQITLSQLTESKATNCRTKATSNTKTALSTESVPLATRCNSHNYP